MPYPDNMLATYKAGGKLILFGEHFVVYGAPALAIPLSTVSTLVSVYENTNGEKHARLETDVGPNEAMLAQKLFTCAMQRLGINPLCGWRVKVQSNIPVGHGLGSSAALCVALIGSLAQAAGQEISLTALNTHAHELEKLVHGTPSGVDNSVVTFACPISFRKGAKLQKLDKPSGMRLLLASSGHPGSTMQAIAKVRQLKEGTPQLFETLCAKACQVADRGMDAFLKKDWPNLGRLLNANHELLKALGVSTEAMDRLAEAASCAGAYGAKMTGSGGGGFVFALVSPSCETKVQEALLAAGAFMVLSERFS